MKTRLLGSAPTEMVLIKLIADYWCTDVANISINGKLVYKNGNKMQHVQVSRKASRFRFELIDF